MPRYLIPGFDGASFSLEWKGALWARFCTGAPPRQRRSVERYDIVKRDSQESLRALSKRYGINQKTVAKWKKRTSVADLPTGPTQPCSTVLSVEDEAAIIAFRKHTLLPLDDCLYALQPSIPHLTRSSLHRCLQRHGISRLPDINGDKAAKKRFKSYPIGYFHIDVAAVHTAEGTLYLFVAIDRTSKFALTELHASANNMVAAQFLRNVIQAVSYTLHTVLTDNGVQFTNRRSDRYDFVHIFTRVCEEHGIEHRLTQVKHPRTNGQVERMNRTIKEATVKRFHYDDHAQLQQHLANFIDAYNYARRLKALKGLTPYEFICKQWTSEPERFKVDPIHLMPGLNKQAVVGFDGALYLEHSGPCMAVEVPGLCKAVLPSPLPGVDQVERILCL